MITEHPTAIEEIVNTFHSQKMPNVDEETQTWILLDILSAIPEQVRQIADKILDQMLEMFLFENFLYYSDKCDVHVNRTCCNSCRNNEKILFCY